MSLLSGLAGHHRQLKQLESDLIDGRLAHAYLFSGPKKIGKTTIAQKIATYLLSGSDESYEKIRTGLVEGVHFIDDDGESLKIAQVRNWIHQVYLSATHSYQIFIIKNVHRMPMEAQNAFLKTLEEPTQKTIFILTSDQPDRLLPTIVSRVRQYRFSSISSDDARSFLTTRFPSADLRVLDHFQGRMGLALNWIKDPQSFQDWLAMYQRIDGFFRASGLNDKFQFVEEVYNDKQKINYFFDVFTFYLRDLTTGKVVLESKSVSKDDLVKWFDVLQKSRYFVRRNVNKKLALENLLIQIEK